MVVGTYTSIIFSVFKFLSRVKCILCVIICLCGVCSIAIMYFFSLQQAKEMVMELIRDQGFREQRGEYGSRIGGGDSLDVSICNKLFDLHCRPGDEA